MKTIGVSLLFALQCVAQNSGPFLRGTVFDQARKPVSGSMVSLKIPGMPQGRLSLTTADGQYAFSDLKPGADYELRADYEGLASTVHTLRLSSPDESATIDLKVSPRILFEEIASKAGLNFILHNGAAGHSYQPEIMLGGVAALDFNNDGCMDIFVTNGASLPGLTKTGAEYSNRLFRNNCNMTFTDVTENSGLSGAGYSIGAGAADFDNDGRTDLAVTAVDGVRLYRNKGNGVFEEVTARAGLDKVDPQFGKRWAISAGWFDYDNDGRLDLFVTNYVEWKPELDTCTLASAPYFCHPRVYKGLPNQLFHNNGDGTFTDVSASSGIRNSLGKGMGVAFGNINGDGLPDIFVANDSVPNFLFQNLGNGRFRERALDAGVAYAANGTAVAGMGVDFRDYDNDGRDDIAMNAMYFDTFPLYRNAGREGLFTDVTASAAVALATRNLTGWGMGLFDFDNDGNKDLFFASSHFPGSQTYVHEDSETPNHVLRNLSSGSFEDVSKLAGEDFQKAALFHGAAFADFDGDGRIDVVVSAVNGPLRLFRNVSPEPGHWLALRLHGTRSNRDGVGTRVRVQLPPGNSLYNHATTAVGYASSSEPLVRFGLGPYDAASEIEIRWPSGRVQMLKNVKTDAIVEATEPM